MNVDTLARVQDVVILVPAYHAGKRVIKTFERIPEPYRRSVILVDDASPDDTFAHAKQLPIDASQNARNLGYGGNMKMLIRKGLATSGNIFVELHADNQYDPSVIPEAIAALRPGVGIVLGSRFLTRGAALQHGMPLLKRIVNRVLTFLANLLLGRRLTEYHSGFHVYSRAFLETVNVEANSNDHLFSFEILLQTIAAGMEIREVPVACAYDTEVTQMRLWKGLKYSGEMFFAIVRYYLWKIGRPDPVFQRASLHSKVAPSPH